MPGVGKSTAGVVAAKLAGFQFLDTDLVIMQRDGRLLREIIEQDGVEGFLSIENRVNASIDEHIARPGENGESAQHKNKRKPKRDVRVHCQKGGDRTKVGRRPNTTILPPRHFSWSLLSLPSASFPMMNMNATAATLAATMIMHLVVICILHSETGYPPRTPPLIMVNAVFAKKVHSPCHFLEPRNPHGTPRSRHTDYDGGSICVTTSRESSSHKAQ